VHAISSEQLLFMFHCVDVNLGYLWIDDEIYVCSDLLLDFI